jgi:uncharacterized protein YjiS (DUF1127 family)
MPSAIGAGWGVTFSRSLPMSCPNEDTATCPALLMPAARCWPFASLSTAVARALAARREWRSHKRNMAMLRAIDARTLRDIGIDRTEIASLLVDVTGERRHTR